MSKFNKLFNDYIWLLSEDAEDSFAGNTAYDKITGILNYFKVNGLLPVSVDGIDARGDFIKRDEVTNSFFFDCKEPSPSSTKTFVVRVYEDGKTEILDRASKEIKDFSTYHDEEIKQALFDFITHKDKSNDLPTEIAGPVGSELPGMQGEEGVEPKKVNSIPPF